MAANAYIDKMRQETGWGQWTVVGMVAPEEIVRNV